MSRFYEKGEYVMIITLLHMHGNINHFEILSDYFLVYIQDFLMFYSGTRRHWPTS